MGDGVLYVRDVTDTVWIEVAGSGGGGLHFDPHALSENVTVPENNTWVHGGPLDLNGFDVILSDGARLVIV